METVIVVAVQIFIPERLANPPQVVAGIQVIV